MFVALGSTWEECDANEPIRGRVLQNEKLSNALEEKTKFSHEELNAFGITHLYAHDVIESGTKHFKPFEPPPAGSPSTSRAHLLASLLRAHGTLALAGRTLEHVDLSGTVDFDEFTALFAKV